MFKKKFFFSKNYNVIIVSLIYTFFFTFVRITNTNQINKYVTHQITLQIKSRCSKPTNQIALKTDGRKNLI